MLRPLPVMTLLLLLISISCSDRNHRYQSSFRAFENPLFPPQHTVRLKEEFIPPAPSKDHLRAGKILFENNCVSCHGYRGDGHGVVTKKGLTAPPSFMIDRLRKSRESHFMKVMKEGYGRMVSFNRRLKEKEMWKVAIYIKALQLSRSVPVSTLDESDRRKLP
jgi:mono/diheme cytochrome c family protein